MPDLVPHYGCCEFCSNARPIRRVKIGQGFYEICAQCETAMEKANAAKEAAKNKIYSHKKRTTPKTR